MNATQTPLALHPVKLSPRSEASAPRKQRNHKPQALEILAMLTVNVLLSATAVSALFHLISYQRSQQAKLQEIQAEVKVVSDRVSQAREQFNRNHDPRQARQIMQEETNRIEPQQLQVVWTDPKPVPQAP